MYDVILKPPRIGNQNQPSTSDYAGQDLEGQAIGPAVPFTSSVQSGQVSLALDFITPTPASLNIFASQDFESLPIGPITAILPPITVSPVLPAVWLFTGVITPLLNIGSDDFESYPIGAILALTNGFSSGDITLKYGQLRPFP